MLCAQSKRKKLLNSFKKQPTFLTISSVPKLRLRSKTPFVRRKGGFSLCKEHSIKFDRIYSKKDLQALQKFKQTSQNLEIPHRNDGKRGISKRSRIKLGAKNEDNGQRSDFSTVNDSGSGVSVRLGGRKNSRSKSVKQLQNKLKGLNKIEEMPEASFLQNS